MVFKNNAHFLGGIFDAVSKNGCAPNGKIVFKGKHIDNGAVGVSVVTVEGHHNIILLALDFMGNELII